MCKFEIGIKGIYIRPLEEQDIEILRCIRNREENRKNFLYQSLISKEEQNIWYHSYLSKIDDYMYSVVREVDDRVIGFAALYNINNNECEFGRLLVDKEVYRKAGLGKAVLRRVLLLAKEVFHISKIKLDVFADNTPAITIYKSCAFRELHRVDFDSRKLIHMELHV